MRVQWGVNYEESVRFVSGRLQFGQREGRARLRELLARVGSPQEKLRCVHVAGTNGKGSTTTFIASVLRAAGYRVGAYLSPYVFDLRERIQINGALIPKEDFARWVTTLAPHIEAIAHDTELGDTTEFELKTAIAFCYFAEQQVNFAVIEVGIGGRLDSTNVIPAPLACVVTSIGMDHMALLGDTPEAIAREKAGILKPGTVCVTPVPPGPALQAIEEVAAQNRVPILRVADENRSDAADAFACFHRDEAGTVTVRRGDKVLVRVQPGLRGLYQAQNAAASVAAVEVLREMRHIAVADTALATGLQTARIPGRFQIVQTRPDGATLLLDGAHNPDGAETLAAALRAEWGDAARFTFVFGTRKSHEPEPVLRHLAPLARRVVATAPPFKPTPAEVIAQTVRSFGLPVSICEPAGAAIRETWSKAQPDEIVVVTGSLYTVGETPEDLR